MNLTTKTKLHKAMGIPLENPLPEITVQVVEAVEEMSLKIGGADVLHPQVLALAVALAGTNTEKGLLSKIFGAKPENEIKIDYTSLLKKQLIEMCEKRDLPTDGNKDDLVSRLVASDRIAEE